MEELKFWDILDNAILNQPPRLKPSMGYSPSSASIEIEDEDGNLIIEGACLRKLWYDKKKVKPTETTPIDAVWKMETGNAVHEMIVEWAKQARVYFKDEYEFWDAEHKVSGRVDLLFYHPTRGRVIGAEIKSIADYHGRKGIVFAPYGEEIKPKMEHVLQATLYLAFFKRTQNIHEWKILYIARDTGERSEFTLSLNDQEEVLINGKPSGVKPQMIYDRLKKLDEYIEHDMLPPRDYELQYPMPKLIRLANAGSLSKDHTERVKKGKMVEKGDWHCSYCPHKTTCWELNKGAEDAVTI